MEHPEHIGIAVKSLAISIPLFEKLLNRQCYKTEKVDAEQVMMAFFQTGTTKIELLESTTEDGVIARFIEKKGEGIHHLAFESSDVAGDLARLKQDEIQLINESPQPGAHDMQIAFLHPKSTGGVLMELCQH